MDLFFSNSKSFVLCWRDPEATLFTQSQHCPFRKASRITQICACWDGLHGNQGWGIGTPEWWEPRKRWLSVLSTTLKSCSFTHSYTSKGFPDGSAGKESVCNAGDMGSILRLGRYSRGGNGNPLQYSCLKNPMDRGAWWATVQRVTQSWTWLNN